MRASRSESNHFSRAKSQELVKEWLRADPAAYLFSPIEAKAEYAVAARAARKTKVQPSQQNRKRKAMPKRAPQGHYTHTSYARAIARGCQEAGVPHWAPNRLRHAAATRIRAEFGLEVAQILLGHAKADITQLYAERDEAKAVEVMKRFG